MGCTRLNAKALMKSLIGPPADRQLTRQALLPGRKPLRTRLIELCGSEFQRLKQDLPESGNRVDSFEFSSPP
ncbi:hypothetical protein L1887_01191 [Cichorium endivia]|nr:hypothetical protein L1887_01191 [Cichorium endivia]